VELTQPHHLRFISAVLIVTSLVAAAVIYSGSWLAFGLDADDIGRLETPFVLSVVKQVEEGPGVLYGPYEGENHLVLIHAPLYYRLAALLGGFVSRWGVETVTASLVAGRLISLFAMILCLAAATLMSRLDGDPPRASLFTVLLIAAAPIPGILSMMVRPDSLAVAFQTWAVFWVLRSLSRQEGPLRASELVLAYVAFALAFCTKQHNLVVPAVSSTLLVAAAVQRRSPGHLKPIVLAHAVGLAVALLYLAIEEVVTGGRMLQSAFVLPGGRFRTINFGSWHHVIETFAVVAKKMVGYFVLAACCGLGVRPLRGGRLELLLMIYVVAEAAALVPLYYYNLGAADNYALQGVVFAAVLTARWLARILSDAGGRARNLIAVAGAALLLAGRDFQFVELAWRARAENRAALQAVRNHPPLRHRGNDAVYFVDRPEYNRLYGNQRLAHDEFVYGAFEAVGAAEPRSRWLRSALVKTGAVHVVVVPDARATIPGLRESLPELGYRLVGQSGVYRVWERAS
jgi:hypothetical protein